MFTNICLWITSTLLIMFWDFYIRNNIEFNPKKVIELLPAFDDDKWILESNGTQTAKYFSYNKKIIIWDDGEIFVEQALLTTSKDIYKKLSCEYTRRKLLNIHTNEVKRITSE